MLWKECSAVEERLRFVARLLEGEAMSDLAREFGISRKTGYKIFNRYKEHGVEALTERPVGGARRALRALDLPPVFRVGNLPKNGMQISVRFKGVWDS